MYAELPVPESYTEDIDTSERILSREACEQIAQRIHRMTQGGGTTKIGVQCWWTGGLRWARNRVTLGADRRNVLILLERTIDGGMGGVLTNQLDDVSLEGAVLAAERQARLYRLSVPPDLTPPIPSLPIASPLIWSANTYGCTAETRGAVARVLEEGAEAKDMLSAGYLEMRAGASARTSVDNPQGPLIYQRVTQAQCSMTVRHPEGTGSGWAGLSGFDWAKIDGAALAERALQKCLTSLNPVRIEPGRYTVVLEPQAVCDMVGLFWSTMNSAFERSWTEQGVGPFALDWDHALGVRRTKLGLKIMDERITISHDLMDPELGVMPILGWAGDNVQPITFVERGVLKTLTYDRNNYSLPWLNQNLPATEPGSFRMSGGTTSIEEMIATTKRGLLVTRFSNLSVLSPMTYVATGVTRDGLWLIENGKISKAVNNMRITESPMFMLNQIEQLGVPTAVFRPQSEEPDYGSLSLRSAIVPPIKSRDFSFTATIDAV